MAVWFAYIDWRDRSCLFVFKAVRPTDKKAAYKKILTWKESTGTSIAVISVGKKFGFAQIVRCIESAAADRAFVEKYVQKKPTTNTFPYGDFQIF